MSLLLLDTHAAVWFFENIPVARAASEAINAASSEGTPLLVSPITAFEIGQLASRGRLDLSATPPHLERYPVGVAVVSEDFGPTHSRRTDQGRSGAAGHPVCRRRIVDERRSALVAAVHRSSCRAARSGSGHLLRSGHQLSRAG